MQVAVFDCTRALDNPDVPLLKFDKFHRQHHTRPTDYLKSFTLDHGPRQSTIKPLLGLLVTRVRHWPDLRISSTSQGRWKDGPEAPEISLDPG